MIEPGSYLPGWAERIGLSPPEPGEGFREHAARLLIPERKIEEMLEGLDERTAVVAHARLGTYLYLRECRAGLGPGVVIRSALERMAEDRVRLRDAV